MSDAMITRRGGGGGSANLQEKTATLSTASQTIEPDTDYDGMSRVNVSIDLAKQKEAETFTPGTQAQTISAGIWLAGAQTIAGDADLVAANIKKGVSIFNVAGSYEAAGLDTNSAILKVVTSTGCSVTVTNNNDYDVEQLDAEGFVRSGDANVTEHFFVIPTAAFGNFSVTATHPTYGPYTKPTPVTIGNAGRVYEVLCGGKNIILDGTFGLQEGYSWVRGAGSSSYNATYKRIEYTSGNSSSGHLEPMIPVTAFDTLTVASTAFSAGLTLYLTIGGARICEISGEGEKSAQITDKHYTEATFGATGFMYITKIVLT